jgi:hypothetical protein
MRTGPPISTILRRQHAGVAAVRIDCVEAVAIGETAHSAADDVVHDEVAAAILPGFRTPVEAPPRAHRRKRDVSAGRSARRCEIRHRLQRHVGHRLLREVAVADRPRDGADAARCLRARGR